MLYNLGGNNAETIGCLCINIIKNCQNSGTKMVKSNEICQTLNMKEAM